jgi:hypothetical protein
MLNREGAFVGTVRGREREREREKERKRERERENSTCFWVCC